MIRKRRCMMESFVYLQAYVKMLHINQVMLQGMALQLIICETRGYNDSTNVL